MDNQHKKIKGYRDLSQAEIDLMNEVKAKGEELRALVKKIRETIVPQAAQIADSGPDSSLIEHEADHPEYWLRHADGTFRTALMFATRAIAQPTSY